jgi:hypothetical protein
MRRIPVPTQSRDECLRRAAELEWLAENCRDARAHAQLLLQLAQGGFLQGLAGVAASAGQGPLPRVGAHLGRAAGQQERGLAGAVVGLDQGERHGGALQVHAIVDEAGERAATLGHRLSEGGGEREAHAPG